MSKLQQNICTYSLLFKDKHQISSVITSGFKDSQNGDRITMNPDSTLQSIASPINSYLCTFGKPKLVHLLAHEYPEDHTNVPQVNIHLDTI